MWNSTQMSQWNSLRWEVFHRQFMIYLMVSNHCITFISSEGTWASIISISYRIVYLYETVKNVWVNKCMCLFSIFLTSVWRHGHSLAEGGTWPVLVWGQVPLPIALISLLLEYRVSFNLKYSQATDNTLEYKIITNIIITSSNMEVELP